MFSSRKRNHHPFINNKTPTRRSSTRNSTVIVLIDLEIEALVEEQHYRDEQSGLSLVKPNFTTIPLRIKNLVCYRVSRYCHRPATKKSLASLRTVQMLPSAPWLGRSLVSLRSQMWAILFLDGYYA
jgi:hypothetical protein